MKKYSAAICLLIIFIVLPSWGNDIPPFYPDRKPLPPMNTTISQDKIKIQISKDTLLEPEIFNIKRSLNGIWKIHDLENSANAFHENAKGYEKADYNDSKWESMEVPLNWYDKYRKLYNKKKSYVQGYYRYNFNLSKQEIKQKRVLLYFEFIGYEGILWINGKRVGCHRGDFVPWTIDISDYVKPGRNQLMMQVLSDFGPALGSVPKALHSYGAQWHWTNIKGGIWGNVELRIEPLVRFEQLYTIPNTSDNTLKLRAQVNNTTGKTVDADYSVVISNALKKDANKLNAVSKGLKVSLTPGINVIEQTVMLNNPVKWSPDNPYLYYATAVLEQRGTIISAKPVRFGFRNFTIKNGKFMLNGKRIYLFGENVPSSYGGRAGRTVKEEITSLYQRLAGMKSLGYNIIRTAHMPMMEKGLDIADEIGIMIYDEWSWCFTSTIDRKIFPLRNERELLEWLDRDFNHPSVVMWSCGNEVRHAGNNMLRKLLDRQVQLMRKHDLQQRPTGSFSGSACWRSFGEERLITDFLDHHSYVGNGEAPWTCWPDNFNEYYAGSLKQYAQKGTKMNMPYIIWECIGFSWGKLKDPQFKVNDIKAYAAYVKKTTSWGNPNGIGYAGSIGLAASVGPARGLLYAQELYGHRLLELMRQDSRIDGFAPWFQNAGLNAATLWTQPVLVGLKDSNGLPPRNLFSNKATDINLFVVNSHADAIPDGQAEISIRTKDGKTVPIRDIKTGKVKGFEQISVPVKLLIPAGATGNVQLRIVLKNGKKEISRNFYPVYIEDENELKNKVKSVYSVIALLDVGNAKDVETTAAVLKDYGIKYEVVKALSIPVKYRVAVIPAGLANHNPLNINNNAIFDWVKNSGGTLVVLEQGLQAGSIISGVNITAGANTFTDIVYPAHPVFKGLTPENFDTWNNPDHGYTITAELSPFTDNAIATRCPMLGSVGVGNAVIEATLGKGRIFWSQLKAVRLHSVDSVAATYLRNIFAYILSGKIYDKVLPFDETYIKSMNIDPARIETIDLTQYVNRGFSDKHANDGKGGWTDQGDNDMRNIPLGKQNAAGVVFNIIDPASNNGKSCIILRGTELPNAPSEVTGIKVGKKFSRLFFLHTAAWASGNVGIYRIHYANGASVDYQLKNGMNIGDWWMMSFLTHGASGIICPNATKSQVGTYVATWVNPHADREIASIDFLSSSSPLIKDINYQVGRSSIPILIAISGEKINCRSIPVDESVRRPGSGNGGTLEKIQTTLPDGVTGKAWRLTIPVREKGKPPYAIFRFDRKKGKLADYKTLKLWIKPESSGVLELQLPQSDWKRTMRKKFNLARGGWRCLQVNLDEVGKDKFLKDGKSWRGELFFFNGGKKKNASTSSDQTISFIVTGMVLE